jgi:hypothetical protein
MKSWRLFGGIALIFVLGAVAGSAATFYYHEYRTTRSFQDPAARKARIMKRLTRDLNLTQEQQRQFGTLVDDFVREREALDQRIGTEIRKSLDADYLRMKEKLDPEQQKKLEELRAKHEARIKHRGRRVRPF